MESGMGFVIGKIVLEGSLPPELLHIVFSMKTEIAELKEKLALLNEKLALFDSTGVEKCTECGAFYDSFKGGNSCDDGDCSYSYCESCAPSMPLCEHDPDYDPETD